MYVCVYAYPSEYTCMQQDDEVRVAVWVRPAAAEQSMGILRMYMYVYGYPPACCIQGSCI